ncbi:hypothetical protein LTR01_009039 [Friedmanniomyces endolithicus]|nr:hypothetical protein LTS00_016904 [Friedmanniomyces endolithicus]KAK0301986.1 hypothetical protein LTR01_009039 [Friedmanniomyces endolithicus]KAK0822721.1 hypothetical protein LTR73_009088 [Friedmanniomyces endolithicus]
MDGAFTISTQTIDTTEEVYVTYQSENASTYTQIQTFTEVTYFKSNVSVPPTPTYDPPKALTAVSSAAQVTVPLSSSATAAATPGSSPSQPATETSQASTGEDTLPSSSSQASSPIAQSSQTSSSQDPGGVIVSVLGASDSSSAQGSQSPTGTSNGAKSQLQYSSDSTSSQDAGRVTVSTPGASDSGSVRGSQTPTGTSNGAQSQLQYSSDSTSSQDPGRVTVSTPGASDSNSVQGGQSPTGGAQSQPQDSSDPNSTQSIGIVLASIFGGGTGSSGVESSLVPTENGGDPGNSAIAAGQTAVSTLAIGTASGIQIGAVIASGESIETLATGGPAVPQGGQQLTAELTNAVTVIGTGADATFVATAPTDPPLVTIGSQIFTLSSLGSTGGVLVDQGTTLTTGSDASVVTVDGQTVRAGPSGEVIVGSSILTLPLSTTFIATASTDQPVVTIGSQVLTLSSLSGGTGQLLADQETTVTIGPDGSVVTVDGQTVHAGPSGELIVGSSTLNLPSGSSASDASPAITNAKSSESSAPSGTTPITSGSSALKKQATTEALCLAIVFACVQALL